MRTDRGREKGKNEFLFNIGKNHYSRKLIKLRQWQMDDC